MKIVVADANLVPHRERFEAAVPPGAEVHWHPGGAPLDELRDADVYVGSRFTADMAAAAEKLRLIHVAGAGTDKVDFDAVPPDVLVANTFHHERSIAEYVVAAAVMLRRDFLAQDRQLRAGTWATSVYDAAIPQAPTLGDARIGFVGFGHIGQQAWNLFRAFGCSAVGGDRVGPGARLRAVLGGRHRRLEPAAAGVRRRGGVRAAERAHGRHDRRRAVACSSARTAC